MNNRNKGNSGAFQIIDIRKASEPSTIANLDLKPLGAQGLALLKEAGENIALSLDYKEGNQPTLEDIVLTILATHLPEFVERSSMTKVTPPSARQGNTQAQSPRRNKGQNKEVGGGFHADSSHAVGDAA